MKIVIGSDHASYALKEHVKRYLIKEGYEVLDVGATSPNESVDYPDYAESLCKKITNKDAELGILMCGTGIGMSIAANKHNGIRAALVDLPDAARLARQHNNANILVLGGRLVGFELSEWIVKAFLNNSFEGGRHERRLKKIERIEKENRLE